MRAVPVIALTAFISLDPAPAASDPASRRTRAVAVSLGSIALPAGWRTALSAELSQRGVTTRGLAAGFGAPYRALPPAQVQELERSLQDGYQQWISGNATAAAESLGRARQRWEDRAGIASARLLRAYYRGLVALALARDRLGDAAGARAVMDELVRRNQRGTVDRQSYGPRAAELFTQALERAAAIETVAVTIEARGAAALYVDGRPLGTDRAVVELRPGSHQLVVLGADRQGRTRSLEVGDQPSSLHIDPELDAGIAATSPWLRISSADRIPALARVLSAPTIITAEVRGDRIELRRHLADGTVRKRVSAPLTSSPDGAPALVAALMKSQVGSGGARPWAYATIGLGAAALVSGATLLVLDGRDNCSDDVLTCPTVYQTATAGWIVSGAGAAVTAAGLVWALWPTDRGAERGVSGMALLPGARGLSLSGRF